VVMEATMVVFAVVAPMEKVGVVLAVAMVVAVNKDLPRTSTINSVTRKAISCIDAGNVLIAISMVKRSQ
jgi:hypothetical protein